MLIVGLTGGIGSGKSTVAGMLAARGAIVIDVDALGREVIAPGGRAEAAVIAAFGAAVTNDEGRIDRAALAQVVFGDAAALARLTAISHPAINAELAERIDALETAATVVLDMAVLVESTLGRGDPRHSYSRVVVVEAPVDVRVARAVARGMAEADVRGRLAAQASDTDRRAVADVVVHNDGDLETLGRRVDELWAMIAPWHD